MGLKTNFKNGFSMASKMTFWIQKAKRAIFVSFNVFFTGESALESLDIILFVKIIFMVPRILYIARIFYNFSFVGFSNPFFDVSQK